MVHCSTVLVLLLGYLASFIAAGCLVDPSTEGYMLPPFFVPGQGMCPKGYLCPNSDQRNVSTFPRFCPATADCLTLRQSGQVCPPQGTYEPYICPPGFYCPNASTKLTCPAGYYCPLGTYDPFKCSVIAHCPEGTAVTYDFGAVVVVVVLELMFAAVHLFVSHRSASRVEKTVSADECMSPTVSRAPSEYTWAKMSGDEQERLCEGIQQRRGDMKGMTFVFSDLSVTVPAKDGNDEKVVLRSVSGTLQPGRVTAVMGPSGAGKTVFFTALLTKLESSWATTGTLEINGQPSSEYERFRHVIGYVPQDDTLHSDLTVLDNVWYSSEARLPRTWDMAQRDAYRTVAMKAVGAYGVMDMKASSLSGSQKKKCSVAVEMASAPSALFLDEPTSSLDATAALELCECLNSVASRTNMTVVMVIHQPRVEIWNGLDQVLFLAPGGFTVYQGSKNEAQGYFEANLGFKFGEGNPADIIIDGIAEHCDRCIAEWEKHLQRSTATTTRSVAETPRPDDAAQQQNADSLAHPFPKSDENASFLRQLVLSHNRSVLKQSQHTPTMMLDIFLGMVAAAIMASAAVRTRYVGILVSPYTVLAPKSNAYMVPMLAMFYQIAIAATTSVTSLRSFMGERECYWREVATGGHHRLAYYFGTTFAELYRLVLTSFHFAVIAYFMWEPLQSFWEFYFLILLMFFGFDSQSSMLSMIIRPSSAPLTVTVAGVFTSLLNGYPSIPFLNYIGFSFYLTEALLTQEYDYVNNLFTNPMDQYTLGRLGTDLLVAAAIIVIYRVIGFLLMTLTNRDKQR